MSELLLRIPEDIRREFKTMFGREIPDATWQLLFSRFLKEEFEEKLKRIERIEFIMSKSQMTEKQAKELADEVSLSVAKRFLKSTGVEYPRKETKEGG